MISDCSDGCGGTDTGGNGRPNSIEVLLPQVPVETVRRYAHLPNALEKTKEKATTLYRASEEHQQRTSLAKKHRRRHKRLNRHRKQQLAIDREKRSRYPTTNVRRKTSRQDVFTFSNVPAIAGLLASCVAAVGLLGTELLSATLLMRNSGWGLTESVPVMVAMIATWVIQPFVSTKMLMFCLPSKWAKRLDLTLAAIGVPAGFVGFWIFAFTLGPMMEAPEFSMMTTEVVVETNSPSKAVYIFAAMISMWLGSYAGFFFFSHFMDSLWPVHAEANQAYAGLTERIHQTEADISASNDLIVEAESVLAAETHLEQVFVNRCTDYLIEAQSELNRLREQIRLSPLDTLASAN